MVAREIPNLKVSGSIPLFLNFFAVFWQTDFVFVIARSR